MSSMRDVAIIAFAQTPLVRREEARNEVEMLMPIVGQVLDQAGLPHDQHRLRVLGQLRLPGRPGLLLRDDPRQRRPVAADLGVPRRDGRRLGAVRGLGEDADRHGRHRPDLLLRQVVARRHPPGADPPARPLLPGPAVARLGGHGRPAGPGLPRRRRSSPRPRWPRWPPAAGGRPRPTPTPSSTVQRRRRRPAGRADCSSIRCGVHDCPPITDGGAAIVLAAGDRARELCERPAWIRGIDHRIEPHGLGPARPDPLGVDRAGRRQRRGGRRPRSTWPSCTRPSPTRS